MIKTNSITKKQLTTLNKFLSKDKYKEVFQTIHENNSIISACDGYKMVIIYKDSNNFLDYEGLNEEYSNILKNSIIKEKSNLKDKFKIEVDRLQLKETLKLIQLEIISNKENKKDKNVMVNFTITDRTLNVNSFLFAEGYTENYYPIIKFETKKQIEIYQNNYNTLPTHTYSFNTVHLLESLELCNTKNIELYFDSSNVDPLFLVSDNVEVLMIPIRPIDIENMREEKKEEVEKTIRVEKENLDLITQKNNIAYELILQAEKAILNNEKVENVDITIYQSKYEYNTTSLVLYLMKKHNINVPLKTQGWINSALCSIFYKEKEDQHGYYTYNYNGNSANSTVFSEYLKQLINAINPVSTITEDISTCSNEELDHLFGKEKGYHDQLEKDEKIKLVKTDLHYRDQVDFNVKLKSGKITENKTISEGFKNVILKKFPSYNSYSLENDNTVLNVSTPSMWLKCFLSCNDYLVVIKENRRGNNNTIRETYKIVK